MPLAPQPACGLAGGLMGETYTISEMFRDTWSVATLAPERAIPFGAPDYDFPVGWDERDAVI